MNWVCLMTIFNFSCVCFRKQTNISATLVSESHVLLHYEKSLCVILNYCLFLIVDVVQNKITNNFYNWQQISVLWHCYRLQLNFVTQFIQCSSLLTVKCKEQVLYNVLVNQIIFLWRLLYLISNFINATISLWCTLISLYSNSTTFYHIFCSKSMNHLRFYTKFTNSDKYYWNIWGSICNWLILMTTYSYFSLKFLIVTINRIFSFISSLQHTVSYLNLQQIV